MERIRNVILEVVLSYGRLRRLQLCCPEERSHYSTFLLVLEALTSIYLIQRKNVLSPNTPVISAS